MRKPRKGEVTCRCRAYEFPHRFSGGRCNGDHLPREYWERSYGGGVCRECHYNTDENGIAACQIVNGAEQSKYCPIWQDFVALYEIRVTPQ